MGRRTEALIGILNGTVGDHLARTANGLATAMAFVGTAPTQGSRLVVLVHGLMNTEECFRFADGRDYGDMLGHDLGYAALRLRYNSGVAIADNGRALARLLEQTVTTWAEPLTELVLIGYSMGGLLVRNACHVATHEGMGWLQLVHRCIYVGTPHLGAPAERLGRVVTTILKGLRDPYTQLVGDIANLRSTGLRDLGDATPTPLLPDIAHYQVVGALSPRAWVARLFGDAVVPVGSASNGSVIDGETLAMPPSHVRVIVTHHMNLCRDAAVYEAIKQWCTP